MLRGAPIERCADGSIEDLERQVTELIGSIATYSKSGNKAYRERVSKGYVTTAVVSILAILSLFATRTMIVATVDNYRSAGYAQGLTTALYAAEVALQDTVTDMEAQSGLATASNCFEVTTLSNVEIDTGLEATASYRAEPLGATTVGSETRYLYRVYATAVYRVASATVSQIVSVEVDSPNTVYLLPATWSDRLAPCALP
ncbi:hypothetical protein N9V36_04850 [Luminiphilus sp.]|nr:hypothetical protein [Luminiphilus sp.]